MARKPLNPVEPEIVSGEIAPVHALVLADEAELKAADADQAFIAARAIGRMEGLEFSATVADRARVEVYLELRQNRAFTALSYKDLDGKARRVASIDEFCEHFLGKSARRVQELASHYHLLGGELWEISARIGFRNQDYRALKALPADDQAVIKQAMSPETDRDQILDLMQELAARHASEKSALLADAKEAKETAEARSEVIGKKERAINTLEEQLQKARHRLHAATPDQVGEQLRQETAGAGWAVVGRINTDLANGFEALDQHAQANDCTHEEFMSGVLFDIERALHAIRERYAVKARPDGDARPDWTREDFKLDPESERQNREAAEKFEKVHGYNPLKKSGLA